MEEISREIKLKLLYTMLKIRRFEEKIIELYPQQEMKTPVHLYIGQEAIAVSVCANLNKDDYIFSTHRNHGHYIAKGADIKYLMAELYGKANGCSGGKGGSMHPVATEYGIMGTSAIVAGGIALAVGTALASKMKQDKRVSVAFFGDGAVDEGTFQESLNFAALKKLPVIFICENNLYATNSPQSARQSLDNIYKKAQVYGIPGFQVDGNTALEIYDLAKQAISKARQGEGPTLIECRTYRWKGHVGPECDYEKGCRSKEELQNWMEKCPIESYRDYLIKNKLVSVSEINDAVKAIDKDIGSALKFAKDCPFPESGALLKDVYYER